MESENETEQIHIRAIGSKSIVSVIIAGISGLAVVLAAYYSNRQLEIPSFPRYAGEALQREYNRNATEVKRLGNELKDLQHAVAFAEFNARNCHRRQEKLELRVDKLFAHCFNGELNDKTF